MTHRYVKTATFGLLWMVSCASHALAQEDAAGGVTLTADVTAPVQSSVLALAVGPDVVDRVALRAALEAELGVVVEDAGNAPAYMPTLSVVTLPNGNTEVALSSRTVPRATREFLLSAQIPEERVDMVTLIAANLIRNEAAALLPELKPKPTAPVVEPPPPPPPPAKLSDPCTPVRPREFGIDLAPGVGASSQQRGRTATRAVSIGVVGTLYDRLQGVDLSWTGASIVRKSVCGVQVSGGATVSWGPVAGVQAAVFNLIKGSLKGAQLGVASVTIGDIVGAQLAVATINHGHLTGAQLAVGTYARRGIYGLQAAVLNLSLGETTGAQLAVANFAGGKLTGAQLGVANVATHAVQGAQLGVANVAAGEVRGLQLGLFNYAEKSRVSLGLFSIVRRGRTSIDLTGTIDSSLLLASVTHGGKYVHNIIGVGLREHPGDTRMATVFGIGVRALSNRWLRLDVDLLSHGVYNQDITRKGVSTVAQVRVPVTLMLYRGLGVMVAPSYNFGIIDQDETRALNNFGSTRVHRGDPNVRSWVGGTLGVRYEFDHGV
ncbi:MAG: hypothetical protein ABW352_04145 [Polyangiales bacterium]